jgi:hypothetical protein
MDDLWDWYSGLWGEAVHNFAELVVLVALSAVALGQAFAKGWRSAS